MDNDKTQHAAASSQKTGPTLNKSEENLLAIFDASPDAILVSNADGVILLASQQIEPLLGYIPAELIGQSIEMLVPDRHRSAHPALRRAFLASPSSRLMGQRRNVTALRKDGSQCVVEIGLSQISTTDGIFAAAALRDISHR